MIVPFPTKLIIKYMNSMYPVYNTLYYLFYVCLSFAYEHLEQPTARVISKQIYQLNVNCRTVSSCEKKPAPPSRPN